MFLISPDSWCVSATLFVTPHDSTAPQWAAAVRTPLQIQHRSWMEKVLMQAQLFFGGPQVLNPKLHAVWISSGPTTAGIPWNARWNVLDQLELFKATKNSFG